MQEIKMTSGIQSYKMPYQNNLIYYKNNTSRKLTVTTTKNNTKSSQDVNTLTSPMLTDLD